MRGGLGGAFARSSACCSRLQIGQLAVRRLWRQKSDTASMVVAAAVKTVPPRDGRSVTEPRRMRSVPRPAARSAKRASTARSTSRSSSAANAAPAQRRTPPPNGR